MTKKKLTRLVCAAVATATFLFGGCTPVAENDTPAQVAGEENKSVSTKTEENVINTSTASAAKTL